VLVRVWPVVGGLAVEVVMIGSDPESSLLPAMVSRRRRPAQPPQGWLVRSAPRWRGFEISSHGGTTAEGRAYYRRRVAAGKTHMEAMRCLKRRLSDVVYRQMIKDARAARTGPGGHMGATLQSSAADPIPTVDTSDQSRPGPARAHSRTPLLAAS
jgi:hypothetical protein